MLEVPLLGELQVLEVPLLGVLQVQVLLLEVLALLLSCSLLAHPLRQRLTAIPVLRLRIVSYFTHLLSALNLSKIF